MKRNTILTADSRQQTADSRQQTADSRQQTADSRNYGIDLLRIISMIMIVVLHTLGHGKLLESVDQGTSKYYILWGMETMAYCAVNCYGLISGYVGYGKKFKLSNLIQLWVEVLVYSVAVSVTLKFVYGLGFRKVVASFFPLLLNQYWYFSAYFLMFFFIPFFNYLIKNLSKKQATLLLSCIILLSSVFQIFVKSDLLTINGGYSALWLSILYIIGAYLKRYNDFVFKKRWCLVIYFIGVFVSFGYKIFFEMISFAIPNPFSYLSESNRLISYNSPTILLCGVALLLLFSKININSTIVKPIALFAPATFAVYLIHDNTLSEKYVMPNISDLAELNTWLLPFAVLGIVFVIWLGCSLIDLVRIRVFRLIRVKQFSLWIERKINIVANRMYNLLLKVKENRVS